MNARTYNISAAVGVALAGIGAGVEAGLGRGLWVAGALVLALTVFGAIVTRAR